MTRIFTDKSDKSQPDINKDKVRQFFVDRASKIGAISYKQAVIYQDKNEPLVESRDREEKNLFIPKLDLGFSDRLIDVGCGTGRWTEVLHDKVHHYHGTDLIQELLDIAQTRNNYPNIKFTCIPCTELSLQALSELEPFNKIIMFGVLIYLNDDDVVKALDSVLNIASKDALFLLREPVGINNRLTIKDHFSDDMDQNYNAIYRTQDELNDFFAKTLLKHNFKLVESDDVFKESSYNNRTETIQKYFLFKRCS